MKKPKNNIKLGSREFKELELATYKALYESGFKDCERGLSEKKDELHSYRSTFKDQGVSKRHPAITHVWIDNELHPQDYIEDCLLHESSDGLFWELAFVAVHKLPDTDKYKNYLWDVCDLGNVTTASKKHNIDQQQAFYIWYKFLNNAKLPQPRKFND